MIGNYHYVVHCVGDNELHSFLCQPCVLQARYNSNTEVRHMVLSATQVLSKRFSEDFSEGKTYFPEDGGSMRFCKDCLNHEDLEMLALGELP
jgi:hypothetical protein